MQFTAVNLVALCVLFVSTLVFGTALPENNLHLVRNRARSTITQTQFNDIINGVAKMYEPVIRNFGATLTVKTLWDDETVNAQAKQIGNEWIVDVYGGLARDATMTPDGLASVVCHEFGHHLGGFPFYEFGGYEWGSAEGNADYFAAFVCARALWASDTAVNASFRSRVSGRAKEQCDKAWTTVADQDLCYRVAFAAIPLATITSRVLGSKDPSFSEEDKKVVKETYLLHPDGQCRLDTALAAGNCFASFDAKTIPGRQHPDGQKSVGAEDEAAKTSCLKAADYKTGFRPACWFKPRLKVL